jgi:ribosome biogenesis GTPase
MITLDEQLYMQHVYQQIGITAFSVLYRGESIDKLKELMLDKVSMFSGHSGWKINFGKCT